MVLLYSKQGQLGNRLWQASYFISNAIEYNYTFRHLGFSKYYECFSENIKQELNERNTNCRIIDFKTTGLVDRFIIKYANSSLDYYKKTGNHYPGVSQIRLMGDNIKYDISQESFIKSAKNKIVIVDGWQFLDEIAIKKHAEFVRRVFKPNQGFLDNISKLKEEEFSKYDKIIGVHIRKGDYSAFQGGQYFYSNSDYVSFITQVSLLSSFANKKVGFLLCSNEPINLDDFSAFNIIPATKHFIEDLYALSSCDLIMGPPSTYSSWASFYGQKPLLRITEKNIKMDERNFVYRWL